MMDITRSDDGLRAESICHIAHQPGYVALPIIAIAPHVVRHEEADIALHRLPARGFLSYAAQGEAEGKAKEKQEVEHT